MYVLKIFHEAPSRGIAALISNRRKFLISLALLCLSNGTLGVYAQNDAVHISQLNHTAWRLREGALPGMPTMVTQTKDGYIWLGTELGLYRFDGRQFEEFSIISAGTPKVNALLADRDGSLWIGEYGGLFRESGGVIKEVVHGPRIEQLMQSSSGEIWAATAYNGDSPACVLHVEKFDCWKRSELKFGIAIAQDDNGGMWVSDRKGLEHREGGTISPQANADKLVTSHINVLSGDGRSAMWASTHVPGKPPTLLSRRGGIWHPAMTLPGVTKSTDIQPIFADREGAIWIGTSDHGLYRIIGTTIDHFDRNDGLSSDDVRDIFQDAEGSIWIATSAGLDQLHRSLVDTWSTREGLTADSVSAILADHTGRIWMANEGGLDVLEDGNIRSFRPENGLPGQTVAGLTEDHLGRIWVGVDKDLYIFDRHIFHKVLAPGGKQVGLVILLKEDARGRMWVRSLNGELMRFSATGVDTLPWEFTGKITAMKPDKEGGMWLGVRGLPPVHVPADATKVDFSGNQKDTARFEKFFEVEGDILGARLNGLFVIRGGRTDILDQHNGLKYKSLLGSERAQTGDFILETDSGYLQIKKGEFARWLHDPSAMLKSRSIDVSDGALPGNPTFTPNSSVAPNGDIWFATDRFPQRLDLKQLSFKAGAPHLVVETLVVNGKTYDPSTRVTLPAGTQDLDIHYAALSYLGAQKVQYKYLLQGFDKSWRVAGVRREAIYTHLPPGTYTFTVTADDGVGAWTSSSMPLIFSVAPRFYQTVWFRILLAVAAAFLLWAAYLMRLRYLVRKANARLFERLSERERIARDLHDSFFQGIQGLLLRFQTGTSAMRPDEPSRPVFEEILRQSDQVMLEGRELVLDMRDRASENEDLQAAFSTVCKELQELFPTRYQITVQGRVSPIQPAIRQELFFIGREALMNAFQHSGAKTIEVEIAFDKRVLGLRVRDDGKGLDQAVKEAGQRFGHFGLPGMRERANKIGATLKVWSQSGAGTEVDVQVPTAAALSSSSRRWAWLLKLRDTQSEF